MPRLSSQTLKAPRNPSASPTAIGQAMAITPLTPSKKQFLLFACLALLPDLPYMFWGHAGDDYRFHLTSWMEIADQGFVHNFPFGWASMANFGLGEPRFCFYPPLSHLLGGFLFSVLPAQLVPGTYVWLASLIAAVSMYALSADFLEQKNRMRASALYALSPYLLITALPRFAAGELMFDAFLPLLLLYYKRLFDRVSVRTALFLAALMGFTWLTNLPAAVMLSYVFSICGLLIAFCRRSIRPLLLFAVSEILGVALASCYLLPAFVEKSWVTSTAILDFRFDHFFLFSPLHGLPFKALRLCLTALGCGQLAMVCTTWARTKERQRASILLILTLIAFFFELPLSGTLWYHLPGMAYVQFPYRFQAVPNAAAVIAVFWCGSPRYLAKILLLGYTGLALLPLILYFHPYPGDNPRVRPEATIDYIKGLKSGYPGTPEYTPKGDSTQWTPIAIPVITGISANPVKPCSASITSWTARNRTVMIDATNACSVDVALFYYPYWRAFIDNVDGGLVERSPSGLVRIEAPLGRHQINLRFLPHSNFRTVGTLITALSVCLTACFALLPRYLRKYSWVPKEGLPPCE